MNIYVGNLSRNVKEEELKELFEAFGAVEKSTIIMDKFTGTSRGFAFVEMPNDEEAEAAIAELNGKEVEGRTLTVNVAKPKTDTRRSNGGSHGGFGGNRGGFGGNSRGGGDRGGFGGGFGGSRGGRY